VVEAELELSVLELSEPELSVLELSELGAAVVEPDEQTPLVQVSPEAQLPVYVPQVPPSGPPSDPYMQYQSVEPSQVVPPFGR